jgi:PPM family protein phosphatase
VLRVAEQYSGSDTGRQRRANEDSLMVRAPLYVVADGMGGAQAGEVASRVAAETFQAGIPDDPQPEHALAALAQTANARIHELSHTNAEQAGMGTTLTALYVGEHEVAIAHVGDSRAYCLRDGQLLRLTDDHSLVDELMRQGKLTPEEAIEHPQRSVITRALGIEGAVEVDTRTFRALAGDVYLLCSDGLTTMVAEEQIADILLAAASLRAAGEALIAAANEAGGRDNITVVLVRLEEVAEGRPPELDAQTLTDLPAMRAPAPEEALAPTASTAATRAVERMGSHAVPESSPRLRRPRRPRQQRSGQRRPRGGRLRRRIVVGVSTLVVLAVLGCGAFLALQSVYFIGTNDRGLVTLYQGVPFSLPGNVELYSVQYVSGVSASTLSPQRRSTLLDHSLRSEGDAASLIRSLELGQLE